jgi:hypothetical protein
MSEFNRKFGSQNDLPVNLPTKMAETLAKVAGSPKKTRPDAAIGSLFKAPTME